MFQTTTLHGNISVRLEHRNTSYKFQKQKIEGSLADTKAALALADNLKRTLSLKDSQLSMAIEWAENNLAHLPDGAKIKRRKTKNQYTYWTRIFNGETDITPECIIHLEHSLLKVNEHWMVIVKGACLLHNFSKKNPLLESNRGERIIRLQIQPLTKQTHTLKAIKTLTTITEKQDDCLAEAEAVNHIRGKNTAYAASRKTTLAQENDVDVQYMTDIFLGINLFDLIMNNDIAPDLSRLANSSIKGA
ncbi:MAG: hypothetical protein LRY67_02270 [Gammaproteobacteria bacterium]|nr:hypothetical protein [Gammaproteobacteria bacterium]